jgi:hypothetical protein
MVDVYKVWATNNTPTRQPRNYLAFRRACERADVQAFSPYQLRHLRAVELRESHGLETAKAVLGHTFACMSDHYSCHADAALSSRAAAEYGG